MKPWNVRRPVRRERIALDPGRRESGSSDPRAWRRDPGRKACPSKQTQRRARKGFWIQGLETDTAWKTKPTLGITGSPRCRHQAGIQETLPSHRRMVGDGAAVGLRREVVLMVVTPTGLRSTGGLPSTCGGRRRCSSCQGSGLEGGRGFGKTAQGQGRSLSSRQIRPGCRPAVRSSAASIRGVAFGSSTGTRSLIPCDHSGGDFLLRTAVTTSRTARVTRSG